MAQRPPFRFEHLQLVREAHEWGELLLAGALGDPADRALLVFYVEAETAVAQFAQNDPYVSNGLVRRWQVLPWAVVVGGHSFGVLARPFCCGKLGVSLMCKGCQNKSCYYQTWTYPPPLIPRPTIWPLAFMSRHWQLRQSMVRLMLENQHISTILTSK